MTFGDAWRPEPRQIGRWVADLLSGVILRWVFAGIAASAAVLFICLYALARIGLADHAAPPRIPSTVALAVASTIGPDGARLQAIATPEGGVSVYRGNRFVGLVRGHATPVVDVAFLDQGRAVVTVDDRGETRVTRLEGLEFETLFEDRPILARLDTTLWRPYGAPVARAVANLPWNPAATALPTAAVFTVLSLAFYAGTGVASAFAGAMRGLRRLTVRPRPIAESPVAAPLEQDNRPKSRSATSKPFVYIVYAREDGSYIRAIVDRLIEVGLRLYIDDPDLIGLSVEKAKSDSIISLTAGQNWATELTRVINEAACVIGFCPRTTKDQSPFVLRDLLAAAELQKLILCTLDQVDYAELPSDLRMFHTLRFDSPVGDAEWERTVQLLVQAVRRYTESPTATPT